MNHYIPLLSDRKDNIIMSASIGVNDSSFVADQKGGAIKPSEILGTVAGISGAASTLFPPLAIVGAPLAAVASIGSLVAKLFGGGLTQRELDMVMMIKSRVDQRRDVRGVTGNPAT